MPSGGSRPGAGRKSNAEIKSLRTTIDEIVSPKDWRGLFTKLLKLAQNGNVRATQLLITYRFGDPYAPVSEDKEIEQIRFIEYVSRDDDGALPFERVYHPDGNVYYVPIDPVTKERLPRPYLPPPPSDLPAEPPAPARRDPVLSYVLPDDDPPPLDRDADQNDDDSRRDPSSRAPHPHNQLPHDF